MKTDRDQYIELLKVAQVRREESLNDYPTWVSWLHIAVTLVRQAKKHGLTREEAGDFLNLHAVDDQTLRELAES